MKQCDFWNGTTEPARISRSRHGHDLERKRAAARARYARKEIHDKHLTWCKDYYIKNREVVLAKQRANREANREEINAKARVYARKAREKNPERYREYERAYREKNWDRMREMERKYREEHREQLRAKSKAYYERHREEIRAKENERNRRTWLQRNYGITREKWNEIFERQGRKCAVCRTSKFSQFPHTDHCHKAGHIRGILCKDCNLMIGLARNSTRVLRAAAKYLSKEIIFNQEL
jgi:hypothetical protein